VCLGKNTSLEVLNLVNTLTQRYPFFKLRQSESHNIDVDLEHNYCLNSNLNSSKLLTSNTCLLIGINPRYEGSKLNLKLRSRFLKGNFNIIQIGSLVNLTFSNTNVGSNTNILKSLIEGNNLFCQEFVNSLNPFFISNTELFKRKDSLNLVKMLNLLGKHINLFSQTNNRNHLNILNLDLNDAGFANFANLKTIKNKDFKDSTGIYFINNSFSTSNIKKLVSLRLLNFFQDYGHNAKILITQSSNLDVKLTAQLRRSFNLNNHLHLPNTVFFETSGTYINTEGNINKVTKVIAAQKQTKSDWQVIRKILSYSKKMLFVTNFVKKNKIVFNSNSVYNFKNYIGFQYYAVSNLNNLAFRLLKKIAKCHIETSKFKPKRKRFYNSQLRF
jgi:NADH dehydrogenase/NADH:ubiquinone oxidoreductase subunit G